jgi:hypothetical protein
MVIEGFKEFEAIRDFLYTRMRGYHATAPAATPLSRPPTLLPSPPGTGTSPAAPAHVDPDSELVSLLLAIRDELRQTREALESRAGGAIPPVLPPGHV